TTLAAKGAISVVARSIADRTASASSHGRLVARRQKSAGHHAIGLLGGAIRSSNGAAVLHMPEGALTREARIQVRSRQVPTVRGNSVVVAEVAVLGPRRLLKRKANLEILLPVPIDSRPGLVVQQTTPGAARKRVKVASRITLTDRHVRVAIDTIPLQV